MTGSLSVLGEVLPIGAVNTKIEAAVEAGMSEILIPKTNEKDVLVDDSVKKKIKITTVEHIWQVLDKALAGTGAKKKVIRVLKKEG
jgi:Lon-like ATP-dependent protease